MTHEVSDLDHLKSKKYDASLITTYNAYLPFYEEVIYPRLIAAGCQHNVVLMDARQYAQNMASRSSSPRSAGLHYTLVPMAAPRAFHPKIVFLVNKKEVTTFVGSHNLTLAGYGDNREFSCFLRTATKHDPEGLGYVASAWQFIESWLESQRGQVPDELLDSAKQVNDKGRLLKAKQAASANHHFLGAQPVGPSLWSQAKDLISAPVRRVICVGAFFDDELAFLHQLNDDLQPIEVIIGVEPDTVSLKETKRREDHFRFVGCGSLGVRRREDADSSPEDAEATYGYLHAKTLFFDTDGVRDVLITGSANPTYPAWLGSDSRRNAEAVTCHVGPTATQLASTLGLLKLAGHPPLSDALLQEISRRSVDEAKDRAEHPDAATPCLFAEATREGFRLQGADFGIADLLEAIFLDENRQEITRITNCYQTDRGLLLEWPYDNQREVRYIVLSLKDDSEITVATYHSEALKERRRKGRSATFHNALASLGSSVPDIAGLISSFNKVVFQDEQTVTSLKRTSAPPPPTKAQPPDSSKPIGPLAVDSERMKSKRKKKAPRLVESGDLAYFLDALIYQLGHGLNGSHEKLDHKGRSEEELVGTDDDDNDTNGDDDPKQEKNPGDRKPEPPPPPPFKDPEVLALCHRKVISLVNRMIKRLEHTAEGRQQATTMLPQLVCTLGLLRALRMKERESKQRQEMWQRDTLVPAKAREKLLHQSLVFLFWKPHKLYDQLLQELDGDEVDELCRLKGLLLWLAWDAGIDITTPIMPYDKAPVVEKRVNDKVHLLTLAPQLAPDDIAREESLGSILNVVLHDKTESAQKWLHDHLDWCDSVASVASLPNSKQASVRPPKVGDLAYAYSIGERNLRVVLAISKRKITLATLDKDKPQTPFAADRVNFVHLQ